MIIGLTGKNASGKGEVGEFLKQKGFEFHSLSDALRDELRKRNKELTRENLTNLGNELRNQYGASVLADRILEKCDSKNNYVIDSFRNPDEVKAFKKNENFILLSIDASPKVRFKRMQARNREKDATTYETFLEVEKRELTSADPSKQNLQSCAQLADHHILNEGTLSDLHKQLEKLLTGIMA